MLYSVQVAEVESNVAVSVVYTVSTPVSLVTKLYTKVGDILDSSLQIARLPSQYSSTTSRGHVPIDTV